VILTFSYHKFQMLTTLYKRNFFPGYHQITYHFPFPHKVSFKLFFIFFGLLTFLLLSTAVMQVENNLLRWNAQMFFAFPHTLCLFIQGLNKGNEQYDNFAKKEMLENLAAAL